MSPIADCPGHLRRRRGESWAPQHAPPDGTRSQRAAVESYVNAALGDRLELNIISPIIKIAPSDAPLTSSAVHQLRRHDDELRSQPQKLLTRHLPPAHPPQRRHRQHATPRHVLRLPPPLLHRARRHGQAGLCRRQAPTAEDAVLAFEAGVEGIDLSNHGARQLD